MPSYLADSSGLLDVFTNDARWVAWSLEALDRAFAGGSVL
jgi:hypothetical protein